MRYHGGKQKVGNELAIAIYNDTQKYEKKHKKKLDIYCEPFCGMCGVYKHVTPRLTNVTFVAGDINGSAIKLWQALQKGWNPPDVVTEDMFNSYKVKKDSAIRGFVGISKSFNGIFFSKYMETYNEKHAKMTFLRDIKNLLAVNFFHCEYTEFSILKNSVIYCDPPYSNSSKSHSKYKQKNGTYEFDYDKFLLWCTKMSKNNLVIISSYVKPVIKCHKIYTAEAIVMSAGHKLPYECLFVVD